MAGQTPSGARPNRGASRRQAARRGPRRSRVGRYRRTATCVADEWLPPTEPGLQAGSRRLSISLLSAGSSQAGFRRAPGSGSGRSAPARGLVPPVAVAASPRRWRPLRPPFAVVPAPTRDRPRTAPDGLDGNGDAGWFRRRLGAVHGSHPTDWMGTTPPGGSSADSGPSTDRARRTGRERRRRVVPAPTRGPSADLLRSPSPASHLPSGLAGRLRGGKFRVAAGVGIGLSGHVPFISGTGIRGVRSSWKLR